MSNKALKEKFDENAEKYDEIRRLIIPCFDDLYNITRNLASSKKENPKILDLGAGTGLLTKYLFEKYQKAEFTLIDISEEMLKVAKNRFKRYNNFKYIVADYCKYDFNVERNHRQQKSEIFVASNQRFDRFCEDSFDIIVSSLSIHHLKDEDKKKLYKKVYDILNNGGIFLNVDQVIGSTPNIDKSYQENWIMKINENNFIGPEKDTAIERMKFDKPATLEDNLKWLKNCGFEDVDIYYKYYNFCIFYGKKFK